MRTLAALLLLAPSLAAAVPPGRTPGETPIDTPETTLERSKQSFTRGDYALTVSLVRPLLYPAVQVIADDEILAHTLLALSYFFLHDLPKVEEEFSTLLQLDANFQLDPITDPAAALALLKTIRERNQQKLQEIAEQRRREKLADEQRRRENEARLRREEAKRITIERTVRRNSRVAALLPFGIGQFQNGRSGRGVWFLGSEITLGAASLILYSTTRLRFPAGTFQPAERSLALGLQIATVTLGALFWVDLVAGIIEALVDFRPLVVEGDRVLPEPTSVPDKDAAKSSKPVGLAPFLSPTMAGLAVQGVF